MLLHHQKIWSIVDEGPFRHSIRRIPNAVYSFHKSVHHPWTACVSTHPDVFAVGFMHRIVWDLSSLPGGMIRPNMVINDMIQHCVCVCVCFWKGVCRVFVNRKRGTIGLPTLCMKLRRVPTGSRKLFEFSNAANVESSPMSRSIIIGFHF